jgi:hypothetical protein
MCRCSAGDLERWLGDSGPGDVRIDRDDGLVIFSARALAACDR